MSFLKRNINLIFVCILEALVGILLLVSPDNFTTAIIIACGIVLLVGGIVSVVKYFRTDALEASVKDTLVKGLVMLLGGLFLVINPKWLISKFPILTILYGIAVLIGGLFKFQWFIDAIRLKTGRWLFNMLNALISIVCAVIILADPFTTTAFLWIFIGVSLIVEAICDLIVMIVAKSAPAESQRR